MIAQGGVGTPFLANKRWRESSSYCQEPNKKGAPRFWGGSQKYTTHDFWPQLNSPGLIAPKGSSVNVKSTMPLHGCSQKVGGSGGSYLILPVVHPIRRSVCSSELPKIGLAIALVHCLHDMVLRRMWHVHTFVRLDG